MKQLLVCICFITLTGCPGFERKPDKVPAHKYGDEVWFHGHRFFRDQPAEVVSYISNENCCSYTVKLECGVCLHWVPEPNLAPKQPGSDE